MCVLHSPYPRLAVAPLLAAITSCARTCLVSAYSSQQALASPLSLQVSVRAELLALRQAICNILYPRVRCP